MSSFTLKQLGEKVKEVFILQDEFQFGKNLQEFTVDGRYVGDFLTYLICESQGEKAPRFYTIGGPYDVISSKAPQQATVYENGNILLNIDYTHYADVRTGLMDALVVSSLGNKSLEGKQILYVGTGGVARESLRALKEYFPEVMIVDYINRSREPKDFGELAQELGITLQEGTLDEIEKYDFIFAHTTSSTPVLTAEYLPRLKKGAFISSFVGVGNEVADEFFTTENVNFIADYEKTKEISPEMKKAIANNKIDDNKVIYLKGLFQNNTSLVNDPQYTLYRSTGTPMQNLAVLKLLLEK